MKMSLGSRQLDQKTLQATFFVNSPQRLTSVTAVGIFASFLGMTCKFFRRLIRRENGNRPAMSVWTCGTDWRGQKTRFSQSGGLSPTTTPFRLLTLEGQGGKNGWPGEKRMTSNMFQPQQVDMLIMIHSLKGVSLNIGNVLIAFRIDDSSVNRK